MGQLPITNGFYVSESLPISHQECTNFFPNVVQSKGLSQETLYGIPGLYQLLTSGTAQQINRGSWVKNNVPYFVNGGSLYSIIRTYDSGGDPVYTLNTLGTIEGTGRVSIASNPTQLMVLVPEGKGYIYNEDAGTPFVEITDADFRASGDPKYVTFVDGVFVCTTNEKKVIHSNLNDGLAWNALDFGSAESDPDDVVAPIVSNNQLYITGVETTEGYQNVGGSGFIFKRNNVFLDKGCDAPFTLIKTNQTFFMVGSGKDETSAIWQYTGNSFQKVSTTAIDVVLAGYTDTEIGQAFSWYYGTKGAYFVGFTFVDRTFVFDLVTQKWHERKSLIKEEQNRWRVNSLVTAYGLVLVGDVVDGRIGVLDSDTYDEYGTNIVSVFSTQPFYNKDGISLPMLELTCESGVGNTDSPDPKVSMSVSKDNRTFLNERSRSLGKIGQYKLRQIWRQNGRASRMLTLRFRISDKVKKSVIRLDAE